MDIWTTVTNRKLPWHTSKEAFRNCKNISGVYLLDLASWAATDFEDETETPNYTRAGFLTPEGYVYRRHAHGATPELIGYTACPSAPNVPTLHGEKQHWFSKRTLAVYEGLPQDNAEKKPLALATYSSYKSFQDDAFPPEARACAYAVFHRLYNKQNYEEYYKSEPYGWRDTALLASVVYAVLFLLLATADSLTRRLTGSPLIMSSAMTTNVLSLFYFIVWALVRQAKIHSIETAHSIQPVINLFNKTLGNKLLDWLIIIICGILYFLPMLFSFNYTPMVTAILFGVIVNMSIKRNSQPWDIASSLTEQRTNERRFDNDVVNPHGDITRTYDWDLDNGRADMHVHGNLSLYFTLPEIQELRRINPFYQQRNEATDRDTIMAMFTYLTQHPQLNARLKYLVAYIERVAEENSLHDLDKLQFALDFVQEPNITYTLNRNSQSILKNEAYIRFPDETLYDKEGDCNSKALLAAAIFNFMGYNAMFLYSRTNQHAAVGVEVSEDWLAERTSSNTAQQVTIKMQGKTFVFCETTGDKFRVGGLPDGMKADTFEDGILFEVIED